MLEEDKKINAWWQSTWANAYIRIMMLGVGLILGAVVLNQLPNLVRALLALFGIILSVSCYFAAKSRWNKI